MTLFEYIDQVGGSRLARRLRCSKQLVSHWRVGRALVSPHMARKLEIDSAGALTAAQLRPDVFADVGSATKEHAA